MRKFKFRFESVEKVRRLREEEALRALGMAQRAFQDAVRRKAKLQRDLADALSRRETLGSELTTATPFLIENDYIAGTKQRIIQAEQGIVRASRGVEKALRAYLHHRRQTRMIELLREKDFEEFKRARAKKEQKDVEDLYVMRHKSEEDVA